MDHYEESLNIGNPSDFTIRKVQLDVPRQFVHRKTMLEVISNYCMRIMKNPHVSIMKKEIVSSVTKLLVVNGHFDNFLATTIIKILPLRSSSWTAMLGFSDFFGIVELHVMHHAVVLPALCLSADYLPINLKFLQLNI